MSKVKDAWTAAQAVNFVKALQVKIGQLSPDDPLLDDLALEAEASADAAMDTLIRLQIDALAVAEARKDLAKRYREAAAADTARAEKIKDLMRTCLQEVGHSKWKGDAGTVSIRDGSWSVEILNASHVPFEWHAPSEPATGRIRDELETRRKELEGTPDSVLVAILVGTGIAYAMPASGVLEPDQRRSVLLQCLSSFIPGATLKQGGQSVTITLPRGKKDA